MIFYTHWAYFNDQASADTCAAEAGSRYRVQVDGPTHYREDWLLRAEEEIDTGTDFRANFKELVNYHGGVYDGGESTFGPGGPITDPHLGHNVGYLEGLRQTMDRLYEEGSP